VTDDEIEALKKDLQAARREIENLQLRLANVTLLLKKEMLQIGTSPRPHTGENLPK
jgi:hypothetical protein